MIELMGETTSKKIIFEYDNNSASSSIPANCTHLIFHRSFNKAETIRKNIIPESVMNITIGPLFMIDNYDEIFPANVINVDFH